LREKEKEAPSSAQASSAAKGKREDGVHESGVEGKRRNKLPRKKNTFQRGRKHDDFARCWGGAFAFAFSF
jgi:hypothetical protein